MTIEYIRYTIAADKREDFIASYSAAKEPLMASPYAMSFDICQCDDDPGEFILRIEWTSAEDHMRKFRGSREFKQFFAHIRPYVDDISEMRHYTRLDES